jgi:hypothetical protein
MLTTAPLRPVPNIFSPKSDPRLVCRQAGPRLEIDQLESLRVDVGTFVADDSLIIDSQPAERLCKLPAAIVILYRAAHRGYCPPIPVLRSLGFRTQRELDRQWLASCWRW